MWVWALETFTSSTQTKHICILWIREYQLFRKKMYFHGYSWIPAIVNTYMKNMVTIFVKILISWFYAFHEINEYWYTTNNNEFTIVSKTDLRKTRIKKQQCSYKGKRLKSRIIRIPNRCVVLKGVRVSWHMRLYFKRNLRLENRLLNVAHMDNWSSQIMTSRNNDFNSHIARK